MKNWFRSMGEKFQRFMYGRYGYDELSRFLCIFGLVLMFFSMIPYLRIFYLPASVLLIWVWIRSFSRNIYKRQMERQKYLSVKNKVKQRFQLYKNMWRDRKTHKYLKCPHCKATVRISRPGKGKKITINCPKCGQEFSKKN